MKEMNGCFGYLSLLTIQSNPKTYYQIQKKTKRKWGLKWNFGEEYKENGNEIKPLFENEEEINNCEY